jgi:hypothetical protein
MGCTILHPEKKQGDVRVLTDFRRLNAVLKKKAFPSTEDLTSLS